MKAIKNLYFSPLFWTLLIALVAAFLASYLFIGLFGLVKLAAAVALVVTLVDAFLLFRVDKGIFARRDVADRLSNGDPNPIILHLENRYSFRTNLDIIDEIPFQFQRRDVLFQTNLAPNENQQLRYELRPTKRGEYSFGAVNVFVKSPLGLLKRRYQFSQDKMVARVSFVFTNAAIRTFGHLKSTH